MHWEFMGLQIDEQEGSQELIQLFERISQSGWANLSIQGLIDIYTTGERPFGWSSTNAAIMAGEIAGLCKELALGAGQFIGLVMPRKALIQTHMFNMGSADQWLSALADGVGGAN